MEKENKKEEVENNSNLVENSSKIPIRHPTEKKAQNPTHSPSYVSTGKTERRILSHLLQNVKSRFNVKEFSRINSIPRTNVYDALNRLERKKLIERELGNSKITSVGINYLDSIEKEGVGVSRRECRDSTNLSAHNHKFKLLISDDSKFRIEKLNYIKNNGIKENKLANLHQIIVNFEDAKVVINPKQLIINLQEFISEDTETTDLGCLPKAIEYAEMFKKLGIVTEGMMVEEGDWARVGSVLSEALYEQVDKRYFLTLSDGSKFWIDHSNQKNEDETDSKLVREKVDRLLNDVIKSDSSFSDIDKIRESLGFITKLEATRLMKEIEENKRVVAELEYKKKKQESNYNTSENFSYKGYFG